MWSCGVMIFILLGGYMPFDESDGGQRKMYDRIKAGQYEFDPAVFGAVSKAATSLIKGLIVVDWQKRLSARAALEHPWFTQHQPHALSETKLALSQTQMKKWRARKRLRRGHVGASVGAHPALHDGEAVGPEAPVPQGVREAQRALVRRLLQSGEHLPPPPPAPQGRQEETRRAAAGRSIGGERHRGGDFGGGARGRTWLKFSI